jgi:hypothetical protein
VHGLDEAMGIRRSRLPFVTLLAGLGGLCFALGLPVLHGGVRLAAGRRRQAGELDAGVRPDLLRADGADRRPGGRRGAFFLRARLFPGKREQLAAPGVTNNVFAIVTPVPEDGDDAERARRIMIEHGADEVEEREGES